jgi:NADP-dependent 3-hydroxy acid dehydrogenase YdfG
VTVVSPGFVDTDFADSITDPEIRAQIATAGHKLRMGPDAIARAIVFAIEQPPEVDVGEIIVRPTAQA